MSAGLQVIEWHQQRLLHSPVLVALDLGDDDVGWVDGQLDSGSVGLLAGHSVDVDDELLSVDLDDLSFSALVGSPDDEDLVVSADGERSDL